MALQRMRRFMHSGVQRLTASLLQTSASIRRNGFIVSIRLHAWLENVFNAADVAVTGTGVRHLLQRQLVHAVREQRHQSVDLEHRRRSSKVRMNRFIRAVAEFYQQDMVRPLALFNVGCRAYRMLVGVLLYMRTAWMYEKAMRNVQYISMLLERHEDNFPDEDF